MAADPEIVATFNGKPLLSEAGMETIHDLVRAHVAYDEAEVLHQAEIAELGEQIAELQEKRSSLLGAREAATHSQFQARHTYAGRLARIASEPGKQDNPVYATVLRSIASDHQGGLWYPHTLEHADTMGRSLVAFDSVLRQARGSQPALIINRERSGHVPIYMSQTKRGHKGLSPATVPMEESRGYNRYTVKRDALAIPVDENHITALQIHPNTFGNTKTIADCFYKRGPNLRENVSDSFKLLLPQGNIYDPPKSVGAYDTPNGEVADIYMGSSFLQNQSPIQIAVGHLSVTKALEELRHEFAEASSGEADPDTWQELQAIALGKIKPPQPAEAPRRLTVETNFSGA